MKKTGKIIAVVAVLVAIGGWIASLVKKCNELEDRISKAEDLIMGQSNYISFIKADMRNGLLKYRENGFGENAKNYNEEFYEKGVKPFYHRWYGFFD